MFKQAPVRAQRFIRAWPVLYRCVGDRKWQRGLTTNIGESGLLLEAVEPLPLGTLIELHVDMPVPVGHLGPGPLWCGAEVVRHGLSTPSIPYPLAARFLLTRRVQGQKPISDLHGDRRARGLRAGVATCSVTVPWLIACSLSSPTTAFPSGLSAWCCPALASPSMGVGATVQGESREQVLIPNPEPTIFLAHPVAAC